MQDLGQGNYIVMNQEYHRAGSVSDRYKSTCDAVRMRRESSLVAAPTFMCHGTARSSRSSDASGQMPLRIARVICTCHISSFVYVTPNT